MTRAGALSWLLLAGFALGACAKDQGHVSATDAAADKAPSDGKAGDAKLDGGDARDGYAGNDGACTAGVPRCHGDFGYETCEQDGGWSESHSCEGYSSNGTTSYCADLPTDNAEPWATCIDPACWYWWKRGLLGKTPDGSSVGICLPDGTLNKCSLGGTLAVANCAGTCSRVATLDGRALGFCSPACANGARECLGGPFYRACVNGRWDTPVRTCAGACNPLSTGVLPDIRCGGACEPGTSRCRADGAAVELCADDATWKLDKACTLGRCRPAGPQAECEAECLAGQHACAFDGDSVERRCDDVGRWTAELPCAADTSCRLSGALALGCVACVGDGNAFGIADSRCAIVATDGGDASADGDGGADASVAVETCGPQSTWQSQVTCASNEECATISRAASTLAACQLR